MLPGGRSQLRGHIQPPARPGSEGKPDASPGAGRSLKTLRGYSDKASKKRMCLHQRKSPSILPAPVPSRAWQSEVGWLQDKMQRTGFGTQPPRCWLYPECFPPPRASHATGQEAQGSRGSCCPTAGEAFRDSASLCHSLLPSALSQGPDIFFTASCPRFGGPLALHGTNPGPAQPSQTQTGPNRHLCRRTAQTPA